MIDFTSFEQRNDVFPYVFEAYAHIKHKEHKNPFLLLN